MVTSKILTPKTHRIQVTEEIMSCMFLSQSFKLHESMIYQISKINFQKLFKRFYSTKCARGAATLANLKLLIQRTNVNGQVKSRFEVSTGVRCITSFLMLSLKKFQ